MKIGILKSLAVTAAVAGMTMQAAAQKTPSPKPVRQIVVSLQDRKLALIEDGQVKKIYSVAVGRPSMPSPEGTFTIERCVANPTYNHNGRTVEPGPGNPVGSRWMGLSTRGYGIHGTNERNSIGKAASHGCIRMAKADLEEFYALVAAGDQVQIVGTRNEQTARLFEAAPIEAFPIETKGHALQVAKAEPAPAARPEFANPSANRQEPGPVSTPAGASR